MAEPIGIAAASLQFLTFAKTCLSVFHEFKSNTPESHRIFGFMLEAEAMKFQEWCDILGVQTMIAAVNTNPDGWRKSPEMDQFQGRLRSLLRFDNDRVAGLTIQALRDMETTFRKARAKLGPVQAISEAEGDKKEKKTCSKRSIKGLIPFRGPRGPSTATITNTLSNAPLSPVRVNTANSVSTVSLVSKASGLFTGVRWVVLDKKTFKSLLDDIMAINNSLNTFLADDAKTKVSRRVCADILRYPGLKSEEVVDLFPGQPEVQTLAVLANELRTEDGEGEEKHPSRTNHAVTSLLGASSSVLELGDFDSGTLEFGPSRTISALAGRPVLVEWAQYAKSINLEHFYRRGNLVRLLNNAGVYRKFQTLPSRGVVVDSKNSRIGLVFDIPGEPGASMREKSLLDLLHLSPLPINQRFAIAKALSTALHSLQSVNWLHKSFRSDNLICFEDRSQDDNMSNPSSQLLGFDDPDLEIIPQHDEKKPGLYLMGWHLSRPDHPSELSQSISISTQGYKLTKEMIKLYSHPDSLPILSQDQTSSSSPPRPRFKLEYDIYSFGLILLEIGLWKSLSSLRQRCASDEELHKKVQGVYCDMLPGTMGTIYWRATKRCLNNNFDRAAGKQFVLDTDDDDEGGTKEMPLSLAFERQVVSELERCVA